MECPCCNGELYQFVVQEDGIRARREGSPPIENDARGDYMRCAKCATRIALERVAGGPSGMAYDLAKTQPCNEKLP